MFLKSSLAPTPFPKISNVNISFNLYPNYNKSERENEVKKCYENISQSQPEVTIKKCGNFYIIRDQKVKKRVYTLFKSGHVNITGIQNFENIKDALDRFSLLFGETVNSSQVKINNSTASGHLNTKEKSFISLKRFKDLIDRQPDGTFNFRPHLFPGAIFRRPGRSTIIIFPSGKYIIVGGKDKIQVREAHRTICGITRMI